MTPFQMNVIVFIGVDDLTCACGNMTHIDGFYPCLSDGVLVEPTAISDWKDLYRCDRCGQVYQLIEGNK